MLDSRRLETANIGGRLRVRQVEVLYRQLPISIATNGAASIFYAAIVWNVAAHSALFLWLSVVAALSVVRWVMSYQFNKASSVDREDPKWLRLAIATMIFSGLIWSLGLIAITPANANDEYHLFSMLWIVGLSAGSMGAYSVLPSAYLAFAAPMVLPFVVYLNTTEYQSDFYGSLALIMFSVFLWFCAKRLHRAIAQSLRLEFENVELIDDLNRDKTEIQRLNNHLEERIESRTLELVSSNEQLRTEIDERHNIESKLRVSQSLYQSLYHQTPSMFFTLDENGIILRVNQFGARKLGFEIEELRGKPFPVHSQRSDDPDLVGELHQALQNPGRAQRWECGMSRNDGVKLWVSASAQAASENLHERAVLVVCEDITQARELADTLAYHAEHDALTGLVNRREFENRLATAVAEARRGHLSHTLLYMDLDLFKVVNDTCGHAAGDDLLRELAGVLDAELGRDDTLARLGGDEFGVLLAGCALTDGVKVAERLRAAAESLRFSWGDRVMRIGISVGVVPIDQFTENSTAIMQRADTACYVSKEHGRNRVHIYDDADEALSAHSMQSRWVNRINEALEDDRLLLNFQAIQPLESEPDHKKRFEILVRMLDKKGEIISAGEFLPAAERYGLTPRIDRWVVNNTLEWLADNPTELEQLSFCCINLSGLSLTDDAFRDSVIQAFEQSQVPGDKIVFEITETAAISQLGAATRFFEALKKFGCRFALDDFGTGLSSFAYLKNLPVDFLKIDGVFIRDIVSDPVDLAMVKSINDMGHVLGIGTIAECVEDKETLAKLREIGVDHAQGFYIDLPKALTQNSTKKKQLAN